MKTNNNQKSQLGSETSNHNNFFSISHTTLSQSKVPEPQYTSSNTIQNCMSYFQPHKYQIINQYPSHHNQLCFEMRPFIYQQPFIYIPNSQSPWCDYNARYPGIYNYEAAQCDSFNYQKNYQRRSRSLIHGEENANGQILPYTESRIFMQNTTLTHDNSDFNIPNLIPNQCESQIRDSFMLHKAYNETVPNLLAVIDILIRRTSFQRKQITMEYFRLYGECLITLTKSNFKNPLKRLAVGLLHFESDLDAYLLRKATKFPTYDSYSMLLHIICTKSRKEIVHIKECYFKLYKEQLQDRILKYKPSYLKRMIVYILKVGRDTPSTVDYLLSSKYGAKIQRRNTLRRQAPESWIPIFCKTGFDQIRHMNQYFFQKTGSSIQTCIGNLPTVHDYEKAILTICDYSDNKYCYYAKYLKESIQQSLPYHVISVVISRWEVDLGNILIEYQRMFKTDARQDIERAFKNGCIDIIKPLLVLMG